MCFSARISFFAVGLLVSIAIATYRKVRGFHVLPFASIPAIFAVQQLAEGVLWLLVPDGTYLGLIALAKYTFLSIALIVWPIYAPFSILLLEKNPLRRAIMGVCLILGFCWSLATLWYLVHYGAMVDVRSCHIYYEVLGIDYSTIAQLIAYCIPTLIPFLVSSKFSIQLLGCLIGVSCIVSYIVWYSYLTSIWCFFAAILSLGIYKIVSDHKEEPALN